MACIKAASRSASVAFSPDSPYLSAGTLAGAVDLSFSSSANLEIFKLDFQSEDPELPVVGQCPSTERFNRLSWVKTGSTTEQFSSGLIAGGLVDGSINIWNPLNLIRFVDWSSILIPQIYFLLQLRKENSTFGIYQTQVNQLTSHLSN
ncbi:protein transport protein SEC31 homolog B-like [Tasmannia lanceolata]|uniref:protein transport protein SEC31 homolog B-like n=1 Tax=Tasmannia lanceolata TaxID=3420 RepID=UPI004062FDC2